jgi:hypothetical protein
VSWHERISAARVAEFGFRPADVKAAQTWVTCACGEQDPRIPRNKEAGYRPKDTILYDLGLDFFDAVNANHCDDADLILMQIEHRSAEILASL